MRKKAKNAQERDDGTYVVRKSRRSNILAFVLCVLVAFVIWAYSVTKEQKTSAETGTAETDTTASVSTEGADSEEL